MFATPPRPFDRQKPCPFHLARSHASMRLEFRSSGSGKNGTACANRLLVQQAATQHECRWGSPLSVSRKEQQQGQPTKRSRKLGGNAFLEFRNQAIKTAKRLMAPDRALTTEELDTIQKQASDEWSQLTNDEVQEWKDIHVAHTLERKANAAAPISDLVTEKPEDALPIDNLWGHREGADCLVPTQAIIDAFEGLPPSARRELAIHDPALVVGENSKTHRLQSDLSQKAKTCSCWEGKKIYAERCWMRSSECAWPKS